MECAHLVPSGRRLLVCEGEHVDLADRLVGGRPVPHDILRISGEEAVQRYLQREIQNVYRAQRVEIDDKHLEIIVAQMLRKVRVDSVGDTGLLPGSVIDKFEFRNTNMELMNCVKIKDPGDTDFRQGDIVPRDHFENENLRVEAEGRKKAEWIRPKPSSASTQLLGITKAAVQSESFISAASFQETTKVLTEAALAGKVDYLVGLKENVILGHLVPAGTGFKIHQEAEVWIRPEALEALAEKGHGRYPPEAAPVGTLNESLLTGNYPMGHSLRQKVIKASQRPGLIVEPAKPVKLLATVEILKQHRSVILETIGTLRFCLIRHNHPNNAKSGERPALEQCTEIWDRIVRFRAGIKNFGEVDLDPSSEIARLLASAQTVLSDMVQVRGEVAELPRLLFNFVERLHAIEERFIRCVGGPPLSPSPEKAPTDTETNREPSVIDLADQGTKLMEEPLAAQPAAEPVGQAGLGVTTPEPWDHSSLWTLVRELDRHFGPQVQSRSHYHSRVR